VAKPGFRFVGPVRDPQQLIVARVIEQAHAVRQGVGQARRAEVVRFSDEDRGDETRVARQLGRRVEQLPTKREVLRVDLFLERDRVG